MLYLNFNSLDLSTKQVQMIVKSENQFENKTVCITSTTTTTGTLTCDLSDYTDTNQFFFAEISVGGVFVESIPINTNPSLNSIGGAFGTDGFFIAILIILT